MKNLFANVPADCAVELTESLLTAETVRIERIVSTGHASPADFWYDQDECEWVLLLAGAARLRLAGAEHPLEMNPGDHIHLPAHRRHRVEWTAADEPTVWLAVYFH